MTFTPLLTLEQTAALLNIPVKTLRDYRLRGTGPVAYKVGQHVRYAEGDVETWLAERRDA